MMDKKEKHDNPKKLFKEQDDLVVPGRGADIAPDRVVSIRRSEITSTAPDEIDWNKIYIGKQHELHSTRPETPPRREKTR